jgi:GNAT superfamily N-acetyltransferase
MAAIRNDATTPCTTEILGTETSSSSSDEELLDLVTLINKVYDEAEAGMWKVTGYRTTVEELKSLVAKQQLIVARHTRSTRHGHTNENNHNEIVGSIQVHRSIIVKKKNNETIVMGGLGMLVVNPKNRGQGIGGQLIRAAETWALSKQQGCTCTQMQLDLLTPRTWKQPSKEFNKAWYTRLGYIPQKTIVPFEQDHANLIPLLATDCDFTIWTKALV